MKSQKRMRLIRKTLLYVILIFFSVIFLIPLFWMISTSLKLESQVMTVPIQWFPKPIQWKNYLEAVKAFPFFRYFSNTLLLAILNVAGTLFSASLVAYSFSKLHWKGRDQLFYITIATMFIPTQILIIPTYLLFSELGWINTYLPLIVPAFCGGGAFNIFLLRQFFISIPDELLEAARIDGASEFRIYSQIVLPLSTPVLLTVSIFTLLFTWNDFFGPLLYLQDPAKWTLAVGLRSFQQQYTTTWSLLMAASTLSALPLIIIYFIFQKRITSGFALSGSGK